MFTVEVKDEFGWFDYATFDTVVDAIKCAKELQESFPHIKIIDVQNQLEVSTEV